MENNKKISIFSCIIQKKVVPLHSQNKNNLKNNKIMKKNFYPTCTLCDTTFIADYEDYVEECKETDREPKGENSNDYWEFVSDIQRMEWEDLHENLKYSNNNDDMCVIMGSCGTWMGRREIKPMLMYHLTDAIEKCLGSCDNIKVELENGHINVSAYHHDGTNSFEIHKLSQKGIRFSNNHANEPFKGGYLFDSDLKDYHLAKWSDYLF